MDKHSPISAPPAAAQLREARRRLLAHGEIAPALLATPLGRSWQRSRGHGLAPAGRNSGAPHASASQLSQALSQQRELVAHARPVMELLAAQTGGAGNLVILADAQGLLLQTLGDARFADRAQRVALRPGAIWHEQWRGTNAIGTALAEGAPVVIHGGEHYLERNGFLTCTAAPIVDTRGRMLGVLDLSGDRRGAQAHTLALVRTAAGMIEHRLFETRHAGSALRLRLHAQAEGLGTVTEGLLALSDEGLLIGANPAALQLLGLDWQAVGQRSLGDLGLELDPDRLLAWTRPGGPAARALRLPDGRTLWLRLEAARPPARPAHAHQPQMPWLGKPGPETTAAAVSDDALAALDSGDPTLAQAIARARKLLDKPAIALLLQGESGVGKELFVRAFHASSRTRQAGPLVALNCAALPEALIEAELFGYRAGAFTGAAREGAPGRIREAQGGTLFLDEIGDMPLALQARLLRVLQEREVQPLGGGKPVAVDFRLVCASHRPLRQEVAAGRFREDLFYRINGLLLQLPPLRERLDQAALVQRLLAQLRPGERPAVLSNEMRALFARYRWPGNLRQLHNALQLACALLDEDEQEIGWAHLPDDLAAELRTLAAAAAPADAAAAPAEADGASEPGLRALALRQVQQTVAACAGNLSEAARRLGISRNTLYRKLRGAAALN